MVTSALLPRWASPLLILSPHLSRRNLLPSTKYSTALLGRTSGRRLHISSPIPPAKGGPQVRARNSNCLPKSCSFCCGVEASVAVASDDNYGNKQVISVTPRLYDYLLTNVREPEILRELREETATMRGSQMQVSPDQAQLLAMLVQILGAEKCIEVGVYTGYSSLAIALVLPESGRLVACERDAVCLEVAKRYYDRAGVSHKVDVKHGLAADVLRSMIQLGETCSYDFAFVDAEKRMYQEYFELLLQLVRVGGLIVMDNVLWHGKVANPLVMDSKTLSIRNFNRSVMEDKRVSISMGYSSLAIALVLPESGRLVACETDAECLEVAKRYYDRAGVSHKVDVKHGLAADVLRSMIQMGETFREKMIYNLYFGR